jgi:hypothetical protein
MRQKVALALCLSGAGCIDFGDGDARAPGTELGEYWIVAELESASCPPGLLETPPTSQFTVRLSRDGTQLFWLNGAQVVQGQIQPDGVSFELQIPLILSLDEGSAAAGCKVIRTDRATGRLSDPGTDVLGFEGSLSYAFELGQGSDCSNQPAGQELALLPCEMRYSMQATRTDQPKPR